MQAHRTQATVDDHGELHIAGLPFQPGQVVEVIVTGSSVETGSEALRSLRGTRVQYSEPDRPVGDDEWDALH